MRRRQPGTWLAAGRPVKDSINSIIKFLSTPDRHPGVYRHPLGLSVLTHSLCRRCACICTPQHTAQAGAAAEPPRWPHQASCLLPNSSSHSSSSKSRLLMMHPTINKKETAGRWSRQRHAAQHGNSLAPASHTRSCCQGHLQQRQQQLRQLQQYSAG